MNTTMEKRWTSWCGDLTERDRRNQIRFALWSLAWMACFVAAFISLRKEWVPDALVYPVVLFPTALGGCALWAFVRFLREADELQRKIQLEALGWGFGCGALFMIGYRLLERVGLPRLDSSDPLLVMVLVWAGATWILARRYS